jgi:predicted RNase H-like HicB family nuclease
VDLRYLCCMAAKDDGPLRSSKRPTVASSLCLRPRRGMTRLAAREARSRLVAGGHVLRSIQIRVQPGEQLGYVAECVDLPVVSQGATIAEAMANIREAVALHQEDEDPAASMRSTMPTAPQRS